MERQMAKPKSSGTFNLAAISECVIDGNGSPEPPANCSETASSGSTIGGSKGTKTDRAAAMSNQAHSQPNHDELWSLKTVVLKTGLSRASIYRYAARGLFPARRRIGPGRVAWLASEVLAWMESRPRTRLRGENPATWAHPTDYEE
jgi:prophage regulatory protein